MPGALTLNRHQGHPALEILKDIDVAKVMFWVVPGAMIALFRSFALRGGFPGIGKDDIAAFVLGSVIYDFVILLSATGFSLTDKVDVHFSGYVWFLVLLLVPAIVGLGLGLFEASDAVGFAFRQLGIPFPSPGATAWESLFRELGTGAVLIVTLKDGSRVMGRWVGGRGGSAASTDPKQTDLFLGEIGSKQGHAYVPAAPRRGIYLTAAEIRYIEVIDRA
jgi:hypothetical protein